MSQCFRGGWSSPPLWPRSTGVDHRRDLPGVARERMSTSGWGGSQNPGPRPVPGPTPSVHPAVPTVGTQAQSYRTGLPWLQKVPSGQHCVGAESRSCQMLDLLLTLAKCLLAPACPSGRVLGLGLRGARVGLSRGRGAQSPPGRCDRMPRLRPRNCRLNVSCLQGGRAYALGGSRAHRRAITGRRSSE